MKKNEFFLILILSLILSVLIFWPFFSKNLHPFPGNYLLAWFEPFKTDNFQNGTITIAHKPIADDIFRQLYPLKTLALDLVKKGTLPLWNPYNGSGMPLFAVLNIGFLDPLNLLFFILPSPLAWSWGIILASFLITICTYLYCRKINLSPPASVFTSVVFLFSGFTTVRLIYFMYGTAIYTLPITLYLLEDYFQNGKSKKVFLLPFSIFMILVSTQPQLALYLIIFIFCYALFRIIFSQADFKINKTLFVLTLMLLGLGLSLVQLIPTFELFKNANLSVESSKFIFTKFLLPLKHLLSIFINNYFGSPAIYNFWGKTDYIETMIYLGLIPFFFIFYSLGQNLKEIPKIIYFFLLVVITSLFLTLDSVFTRWFYTLPIPLIATGTPSRIFLVTTFSLAILAGFGLDAYLKDKVIFMQFLLKKSLFVLIVIFIAAITLGLFLAKVPCEVGLMMNCRSIALRNVTLEVIFFGVVYFLVAATCFSFFNPLKKIISIIIIILISILGLYHTQKYLPFSSYESFKPQNKVLDSLIHKTKDGKVIGLGEAAIATDLATLYHFYDPQYYHPLYLKRYGELINYANKLKINADLPRSDIEIEKKLTVDKLFERRRERLFNLLSVKYLLYKKNELPKNLKKENIIWSDKDWSLYENKTALPSVYLVNNWIVEGNQQKILTYLFDAGFSYGNNLVLEESPNLVASSKINKLNKIITLKKSENYLKLKINSKENNILVLTENYYPGWEAYLNGKKTKILRANYTFRAVAVPKGDHLLEFKYQPGSLKYGIYLSLFSLLSILALYLFRRKIIY